MIPLRHADAHGDHDGLATLTALVGFRLYARAESAPHREPAGLDRLAQLFEVGQAFLLAPAWVDERKLFTAVSICRAATGGLRQPRRDESEDVVARVVAIRVVEALEVIDVDHGDGELPTQSRQGLIQRAAAGQLRQAVAICP